MAAPDVSNVLRKYHIRDAVETDDPSGSAEFRADLQNFVPDWNAHDCTKDGSRLLSLLELDAPPLTTKSIIQSHREIMKHAMDALQLDDVKVLRWFMTVWYDMLRDDSSCFSLFEFALGQKVPVYDSFIKLLKRPGLDMYVADRALWILSNIVGHSPGYFSEEQVKEILHEVIGIHQNGGCSPLGTLDAIVNILKADTFRMAVWHYPGVAQAILKVPIKTASAPHLYKCVFAIWMFSFDHDISQELKQHNMIDFVKDLLTISKIEKVVRLCLTLIKNFLSHHELTDEIVEANMLEAVQMLEYEKWRDTEMYDDIRDVTQMLSNAVNVKSSFERYEQELHSGCLSWGFIHTDKFWKENVTKFEKDNFKAIKLLCKILMLDDQDMETLAVACHDIGQFVVLHPLGKKIVNTYHVKDRIMELMSSNEAEKRDVRREALMCCQKLMLTKWQDAN
jgi:V-type H+-transporting ATPase subunit H